MSTEAGEVHLTETRLSENKTEQDLGVESGLLS